MANLDPITGGAGGLAFRDGTEGSGGNHGFLKNTPVEINEAEVPRAFTVLAAEYPELAEHAAD